MSALSIPKQTYSADTRSPAGASHQGGGGGLRTRSSYHWAERSTVARSRNSSSADGSAKSLFINPFGFHAKTSYDATEALLQCRSDVFQFPEPEVDDDIWKRPPPDFRPQCYAPRPPKRNSREAMQPWKYGTLPGKREVVKRNKTTTGTVRLPSLLQEQQPDKTAFVTDGFDIPDSYQARLIFAREGMNKPGPFIDPKHHDFRGYPPLKSLGLDEFEMKNEHDPYNLRFKTERLDVMYGLPSGVATDRDTSGQQMAPPLPAQPEWEARLILPKSPWPKLSGEYTRYRRQGRSPHSALMERIEEQLSHDWARQKLHDALRKCENSAAAPAAAADPHDTTVPVKMQTPQQQQQKVQ